MGQIVPISLGLGSNPARKKFQAGAARLTNCFAEELGEEGKKTWVIYGTEGLTAFGSALTGGGIRELHAAGDTLYAVAGRLLHAVNVGGSSTLLGGIPTDGHVYMRANRRVPAQFGIVSDGLYYVVQNGVLTQIQDEDLPPPTSLAWLDGYGILPTLNGEYYITGLDDFSTIDGLDFGSCESKPDEIVRAEVLGREAVFLGTESIEWHGNTGDADFPLERQQTTGIGCLKGAARSVCLAEGPDGETLIWVAPDHTVRRMVGYSGAVISNNEISEMIKDLAEAGRSSELQADAWAAAGMFFCSLSCADWTRVYDSRTGRWHDRRSFGRKNWRVQRVARFGNRLIVGDRDSGQLYEMRNTVYDEAGEPLVAEIITPHVTAEPYAIQFNRVEVSVATGVGLNTTDEHGEEPKLLFDWSDDDGQSWSAPRERSLGRLGHKKQVIGFNGLGTCFTRGRVFRLRVSAPVDKLFMSMTADVDILRG